MKEFFDEIMEDEFVLETIKSFESNGRVGVRKIPNIIEHTVGYSFRNNNPHLIKFEWLGKTFMLYTKNVTTYFVKYELLDECQYEAKKQELQDQIAYKARYDAVPDTAVDLKHLKHRYLRMQDNPDAFPKATGTGIIEGSYDMGSCQCGDVDWKIKYNCSTLEFTYSNSNWSNRSDHVIPYVGNALEILCKHTNILKGWTYVDTLNV